MNYRAYYLFTDENRRGFFRGVVLWPCVVLLGQLILLTLLWSVYGITSRRAYALPAWGIAAYRTLPHLFTFIVTQVAVVLSLLSSL